MAGRNFLFVPGPTNVPDRVLRAMMVSMEDHRSPAFPELTRAILPGLKKVFRTERGTPFVFPSSGTGCWEAALPTRSRPVTRCSPRVSASSVICGLRCAISLDSMFRLSMPNGARAYRWSSTLTF